MRRSFLLLIGILAYQLTAFSQNSFSVVENEPVLIYSLPQTQLCIQVEIEKTVQKPGEFYRYSERYLATKDVVTEEKTNYVLKNIQVITNSQPDPERTFSIATSKKGSTKNVTVNQQGILYGLNLSADEVAYNNNETVLPNKEKAQACGATLLPLTEEYMLASSIAKMAEGAAKQIYRIRESRISLLTGDVDQFPADGESFKAMLDGMDKMEKELTELFIGKTTTETQTHILYITPKKAMKSEVLFRISALKGLVASNDLSGTPYYINVSPEEITVIPQNAKSPGTGSSFYSILPVTTQVSIGDGKSTFYSDKIDMPQFGPLIPIPENLLQGKIRIDTQTGRLLKTE